MTCDVLVFNIRRVNNATTHAMHKVTNSRDSPSSKSHVLPPWTAAVAAAAPFPFPTLSSSAASIVPDRTRMRPFSPGGSLLRIPPDTTKERSEDTRPFPFVISISNPTLARSFTWSRPAFEHPASSNLGGAPKKAFCIFGSGTSSSTSPTVGRLTTDRRTEQKAAKF